MQSPLLTACILTRNSESTIADALQSILPHVDQVVVIDSGSTDQTIPIIRSFHLDPISYQWRDNFADARNFAIQQATGDWILFLDSDETFHWQHPDMSLTELLTTYREAPGTFLFTCHNFDAQTGELLLISHAERLFPREGYQYKGTIHEQVTGVSTTKQLLPFGIIHHTGYSASLMPAKTERNIRLLTRELDQQPDNGLLYRYLANEYFNLDRYDQCVAYCQRALALLPLHESYGRAQAYYYYMMAHLFQGELEQALQTAQLAQAELPTYSDPFAVEFDLQFYRNHWQTALDAFARYEECLRIHTVLPQHLIRFYDDFVVKQAQAYAMLGEIESALITLRRLLLRTPAHEEGQRLVSQLEPLLGREVG